MKALKLSLLMLCILPLQVHSSEKRNNMFGTDGIRAKVGTQPFTATNLHNLGKAIAKWVINTYGENATILLGHDTRLSCSFVKSSLKSGMLSYPICIVDAEVQPTPAIVELTLKHENIDCGIIISASHNPYQDNGIKIIDGTKGKLSELDEEKITEYYAMPTPDCNYNQLGEEHFWKDATERYMNYVQTFFEPNFLKDKKIVLDCSNGATSTCAIKLFEHFGATVIPFANKPNGTNINASCGAVHPEECAALVVKHNADAGFAFDGDGDRVIAINKNGQIKDGDDILALLLDHPIYKQATTMVGTIMTNKGLEDWLKHKHITLHRTPVGDKYIARKLQKDNLIIGGEQSGHIILHDYLPTGDGVFTALRVMEAILQSDNDEMQSFERFPQVLINVEIEEKKDLTQEPFNNIIKYYEKKLSNGRIVVRFSGTEQKLRVMIENDNKEQAVVIAQACAQELQAALKG